MIVSEKNRRKIARARIVSVESAAEVASHVFEEFRLPMGSFESLLDNESDVAGDSAASEAEPYMNIPTEQYELDIQSAYDRGFTDGQSVTSALMEAELNTFRERNEATDAMLFEMREQLALETDQMNAIAVNIALAIAEHILHREVSTNSMVAVEQAKKVLSELHGTREVTARINPGNYETLKEANSQLLSASNTLRKIDFISDESVELGGCVIETSMGTVDTQFRHQLENMRKALEETVKVRELAGEF